MCPIRPLITSMASEKGTQAEWMGARVKNIETLGERSTAGLQDNNGVMITELSPLSAAGKNHLKKGDVIVKLGNRNIHSVSDLLKSFQSMKWMGQLECSIIRDQKMEKLNLDLKL